MADNNASEAIKVLSAQIYKVATNAIKRARYDKTVAGRITKVINSTSKKYEVDIQGETSAVYSNNDINYSVNDSVWITIPQNDYNNKFISGRRR